MDARILSASPGSGSYALGSIFAFPAAQKSVNMVDAFSQFSLDGIADHDTDSVVLCEEEEVILLFKANCFILLWAAIIS